MRLVPLALLLAAGAAPKPSAQPAEAAIASEAWALSRSGSRIKRRVVRSADGAAWTVEELFDSKLNTSCVPRTAADGKTRCLPAGYGVVSDFADPECKVPVASFRTESPETRGLGYDSLRKEERFAGRSERKGPEVLQHIHRLGRPYSGPLFRRYPSRGCVPESSNPHWSDRHLLGPEVPAAEFVEASYGEASNGEEICPECCLNRSGSRLLRRVIRTADGAVIPADGDFRDPVHQRNCSPGSAADGTTRCFPTPHSSFLLFADSDCTARVALLTGAEPPSLVAGTAQTDLHVTRVYSVLGEHKGPLYGKQGASCDSVRPLDCVRSPGPPEKYWRLGPETPPTAFALLAAPVLDSPKKTKAGACRADPTTRSGTRLKFTVVRGPDHSSGTRGIAPFDTTFGSSCVPAIASDGKLRCVVATRPIAMFGHFFSDQSCKVPLVEIFRRDPSSIEEAVPQFAREVKVLCQDPKSTECPGATTGVRIHIHSVSARHSGPVFKREPGGSCAPHPADSYLFYSLGKQIPPRRFVELTETIE